VIIELFGLEGMMGGGGGGGGVERWLLEKRTSAVLFGGSPMYIMWQKSVSIN